MIYQPSRTAHNGYSAERHCFSCVDLGPGPPSPCPPPGARSRRHGYNEPPHPTFRIRAHAMNRNQDARPTHPVLRRAARTALLLLAALALAACETLPPDPPAGPQDTNPTPTPAPTTTDDGTTTDDPTTATDPDTPPRDQTHDTDALPVLPFRTHAPEWLRFQNQDPHGQTLLQHTDIRRYPVRAATAPQPLTPAQLREPQTQQTLLQQHPQAPQDNNAQCDTRALQNYNSTDLLCRPGTLQMPHGHVLLILYHPHTQQPVAITQTLHLLPQAPPVPTTDDTPEDTTTDTVATAPTPANPPPLPDPQYLPPCNNFLPQQEGFCQHQQQLRYLIPDCRLAPAVPNLPPHILHCIHRNKPLTRIILGDQRSTNNNTPQPALQRPPWVPHNATQWGRQPDGTKWFVIGHTTHFLYPDGSTGRTRPRDSDDGDGDGTSGGGPGQGTPGQGDGPGTPGQGDGPGTPGGPGDGCTNPLGCDGGYGNQ